MNNSDFFILVVDDQEDLAEICSETFELEDFQTEFKLNGEDALELFKSKDQVHVIVSDAHMPGISGLELLDAIKASDKPEPLFYLCTGDVETTEEELITRGGKGLILKPYSLEEVVMRITNDIKEKFT